MPLLPVLACFLIGFSVEKNALKHQAKAVEMLSTFLNDENLSDKEKNKMYLNYKLMRMWFALPLMLIASPFIIVFYLASSKNKPEDIIKENSEEFDRFFAVLMQMYMAKNPIISMISMTLFGFILAIFLVIGSVLNKASKIPNYTMLLSGVITKIVALKLKEKHAH
ncbi:hypothetical protein CRG95_05910 [Escherichia sp. E4208]|uniref:hypothetical protein n=1 Tax=Escherichia sp. E4208 TaxID=2044463 RepID=UPI00107FC3D9|nr:hypothetical protein [Escherichia sp. E4208]TGB86522.1 hypothetical protein CRG95_05910 [Escherichia sp. E4208]